jgi:hypothetical protein
VVAKTETRAPFPSEAVAIHPLRPTDFELLDGGGGAGQPAGNVVAYIGHAGRARLCREHGIEAGHPISDRRGNSGSPPDLVECRPRYPANGVVEGVKGGQKLIARRANG